MIAEVESTDVAESMNVESTDVFETTDVESTDVVEFTDVSGSSGGTLNLLELERFVVARVEPGGDVRDRLMTQEIDWW